MYTISIVFDGGTDTFSEDNSVSPPPPPRTGRSKFWTKKWEYWVEYMLFIRYLEVGVFALLEPIGREMRVQVRGKDHRCAVGEAFEVRTSGARQVTTFSPASSRVARGEGA